MWLRTILHRWNVERADKWLKKKNQAFYEQIEFINSFESCEYSPHYNMVRMKLFMDVKFMDNLASAIERPIIKTFNEQQRMIFSFFHEAAHAKQWQIKKFCCIRKSGDIFKNCIWRAQIGMVPRGRNYYKSPLEKDANLQALRWCKEYFKTRIWI